LIHADFLNNALSRLRIATACREDNAFHLKRRVGAL
jgi:hypothetical protein